MFEMTKFSTPAECHSCQQPEDSQCRDRGLWNRDGDVGNRSLNASVVGAKVAIECSGSFLEATGGSIEISRKSRGGNDGPCNAFYSESASLV